MTAPAAKSWDEYPLAYRWTPPYPDDDTDPYAHRDESRTAEQAAHLEPRDGRTTWCQRQGEPDSGPGPDDMRDGAR